ncbi:MAG TPA: HEAT repeat domain-containing protein [Vicinamibacterales bacterium]|nr:HEAT repeat domain-containing protein [Vicinamibacterales bacterium]
MSAVGILTVDAELTVRTWDDWLAAASGIQAAAARGRRLTDVVPDLAARGLLARFEQVLATGEVQVLAPAFHHYLVPCPPASPSPHFTHMQQRVTLGALRDDTRIVGVLATIEDVTARLDAERARAAALRSADPAIREAAVREVAAAEAIEQPRVFEPALRDDNWRVRRAAVEGLSRHAHRDMLASLLTALRHEHHDFNVLSSALTLLATSDMDVTAPLIELLQGDDADLRMQAALALGEQQHPAAADALVVALDDPDQNVRFHAIEALGRLRAAEAVERLADLAESGDFFLAFPAIDALARINDARVAQRLVPMLANDDIREPVIDALGELAGAEAVAPLVEILNRTGAAPAVARALVRLYERYEARYGGGSYVTAEFQAALKPAGAQRVLDAVTDGSADTLRPLVTLLGWLRGPAVEQALTRLLGRPEIRTEVIEAIVRQDAGVVDRLVEQLSAGDDDTRLAAIGALGRIGDRRAVPALTPLLAEQPPIAIATAGALARIGDARAFEPLLALLAHEDAPVRQAVVGALNSLGHPDMSGRIKELLEAGDPRMRESAVRIAGYFGYRDCVDALLARCDDPVETVRRAAVEHLPYLDDDRALEVLLRAAREGAPKIRAAAAQALARIDGAPVHDALLAATRDGDGWVRYYAARALGERGDERAVPRLAELAAENGPMHVRIAALEAVGAIDGPAAPGILLPHTDGPVPELAAAALRGLGRLSGHDGAAAALRAALRSDDPERRLAAVTALTGHAETTSVEALQWTAGADHDSRVAEAAVAALGTLARRADAAGDAGAAALVALTAEQPRRDAAIAALASLPPARVDRVAAGLADPRPAVRQSIIAALGRLKHPAASAAIRAALADGDPAVREAAVTALDRLGARGVSRLFAEMARDDGSRAVRRAAAAALGRQGAGAVDRPGE